MNPQDLSQQQLDRIGFLAQRRHGNHIGGESRDPAGGRFNRSTDPASELVVAEAPDSDARDVDAAVAAARRTLEDSALVAHAAGRSRALLFRLSQLIEAHGDELSAMKTLKAANCRWWRAMIDVGFSAEFVRYMAGWATKLEGSTLQPSIGRSRPLRAITPTRSASRWASWVRSCHGTSRSRSRCGRSRRHSRPAARWC